MDPICHTLVGATMAQAGLKERTPLATATLVIGANLPDIDAVTFFLGGSLQWRRGWTHGVLALAVLPLLLTGVMLAWDRLVRDRQLVRRHPFPRGGALLWLSTLAVLTHPTLDYMNNYGMRWLMPFANQWFYGDALYIVDPGMWSALALGSTASWLLSRRRPRPYAWPRPARFALSLVAIYAVAMLALAQTGRAMVADEFAARGIRLVRPPMVAPVLLDVRQRYVVADDGERYHVTGFRWWPSPALDAHARVIAHGDSHPAIAAARADPEARGFLTWARFPFYAVEDTGESYVVTLEDARYAPASGRSWAAREIRVPKRQAEPRDRAVVRHARLRFGVRKRMLAAFATWCSGR